MHETERWESGEAGTYTAEMQAELDRMARLVTAAYDFSCPPDAAIRALDSANARIWNLDPPPVAAVRHAILPGDEGFGAAPCEAAIYTPAAAGAGLIFYVHGGGWALLDLTTHDRLMRQLANEAGMTVVGVHYRLAPEHPYPAGLRDVIAAFRHVASHRAELGLPAGPVVIAGDSAGANLALATCLHEIDGGLAAPAGAILFYGAFGQDFDAPSYRRYADGHVLTTAMMRKLWGWYTPADAVAGDPLMTPALASDAQLRALPPLFLAAAEIDPLASDTYRLKRRLDALGRDDALLVEPGVIHGFVLMTATLAAARRVVRAAAQAARRFAAAPPLSGC